MQLCAQDGTHVEQPDLLVEPARCSAASVAADPRGFGPPPPAPPCTVANLKARTAGDKGWPIACANVVIGDKTQDLDLNSASLSYGDFEGATFNGKEKIDLQNAGLENANLRGSKFEMIRDTAAADSYNYKKKANRIIFTDADLENADLSHSTLYADSKETYDNKVSAEG